jgi:hypothetical protein
MKRTQSGQPINPNAMQAGTASPVPSLAWRRGITRQLLLIRLTQQAPIRSV